MRKHKNRALAALVAAGLTLAACSGKDGAPGAQGTPGTPGTPPTPPGVTKGLHVAVTSVSTDPATSAISVRFTLKDDRGYPVDIAGIYSVNSPVQPRFSLAYVSQDVNGYVLPYNVLTQSSSSSAPTVFQPTAYNPAGSPAQGSIVENDFGDYTYTFPAADITAANGAVTKAVAYDPAQLGSTHTIWIQATRQTDVDNALDVLTFFAVNQEYDYIPNGSGTPLKRELVLTSNCSKCHSEFKPETLSGPDAAFHGGGRVEAPYCNVCHNPGRVSNPDANSMVFIHRIHNSEMLVRQTTGTSTTGIQVGGNTDGTDLTCSSSSPCTCTVANPCVPDAFHGIADVTYPQDIRRCNTCHGGAAQGGQALSRPSRQACGSCHDYVDFDTANLPFCAIGGNLARDANGVPIPCQHYIGPQSNDNACVTCHDTTKIAGFHLTVAPPDPNNTYAGGTNANTNAAFIIQLARQATGTSTTGIQIGTDLTCTSSSPCTCTVANPCVPDAPGAVPADAAIITYDVKSVSRNGSKQPVIVFKLKKTLAGTTTDVVFNTCVVPPAPGIATQELMDGFVGGPSVFFAFALPQDGIAAPADFNVTASGYIRNICNNTATGNGAGTITGPDGSGYYTITLTAAAVNIPDNAVMLTGGLGYTYSLTSTQPLTQINLPAYPYGLNNKVGGLLVPAPDVWKVATGYKARRTVVDNAKCNNCHVMLGITPTFHAGQRNDGPTCSFCHTPNRTSGGWSANVKDIIHDIHGARKRVVDFTWHATSATENFAKVTFPSRLNNCEACHIPGGFDFTVNAAALPNLLWSTEATYTGTQPADFILSPYLATSANGSLLTDASRYGVGFSTSTVSTTAPNAGGFIDGRTVTSGTQLGVSCAPPNPACTCTPAAPCLGTVCSLSAPCQPDLDGTLVTSPITAACIQCHDRPEVRAHILDMGGSFYEPRRTAFQTVEQCLICHGHGTIADISEVHLAK